MKLKKRPKLLSLCIIVLGAMLTAQLVLYIMQEPQQRSFAMWKNNPASLEQAKELADQIVLGRVIRVQRAEDLVVNAPGEPGDEFRIPIEVVTLGIEKTYKGSQQSEARIFHTGLSVGTPVVERQLPTGSPPELKPPEGLIRPRRLPSNPTELESRTILLDEDPPYNEGDVIVALLMAGPAVTIDQNLVETMAMISPHGRYKIIEGNVIEPVTERGFAGEFRGRRLEELEQLLQSR